MPTDQEILRNLWVAIQELHRSNDSEKLLILHQKNGLLQTYMKYANEVLQKQVAPPGWKEYYCPHYFLRFGQGLCEILMAIPWLNEPEIETCPYGRRNKKQWASCPIRALLRDKGMLSDEPIASMV